MTSEQPLDTREFQTMTGQVRTTEELLAQFEQVNRVLQPDVAHIMIKGDVETELSKFMTASGLDLTPPGSREKLQERHDLNWDMQAARLVVQADLDAKATIADLERRAEGAMRPPIEPDPARRDMRTLVLFRTYEGLTLDDIITDYIRTPDSGAGADPTFVSMVESRPADLARLFKLAPLETDRQVAAMRKLQAAIADRRAQRADPVATAALARLREPASMLSFTFSVRAARNGELSVARRRGRTPNNPKVGAVMEHPAKS